MAVPIPKLTVDQYLAIEREAEYRSEYHRGGMFAMAGGTGNHSALAMRTGRSLGNRLEGRKCEVHGSDMRLQVEPGGLHTYPDVSVVCGAPVYATRANDVLVNPKVIVEVLSKSTEAHDRGFKFQEYKKIVSLEEYVLVSQYEPLIERFGRRPGAPWTQYAEARGFDATIEFESLGISIPLAEIYDGIEFES